MTALYISDAAIYRDKDGNSNYNPCSCGVHLCGQTDDGKQPTTMQNYPAATEDEARQMWLVARVFAECEEDEADFIVDLMIDDEVQFDFWSNRQIWPRAIEAWESKP